MSAAARAPFDGARVRDAVALACLAAPLLTAAVLAFRSGGNFLADWGVACAVLLLLAAIGAVLLRDLGGPLGIAALAGWAGLAVWQGLSTGWADEPAAARDQMGLTLLYAAALCLGLLGLRRRAWLPRVSEGVLIVTTLICGAAVTARLAPGSIGEDVTARLSWPIGYWNGLGAVAALGLVLAVATGSGGRRPSWVRGAACGLVPLFGLTIVFAISRGALLVAVIGLAAAVLLAPGRIETLVGAVVTLGVTVPLAVYVNGLDTLVALKGQLPDHADDGRRVGLLLLGAVVASGLLGLGATTLAARTPPRARTVTFAAIGGVIVVAALGSLIAAPPPGGAVGWVDRQIDDFKAFKPSARDDTASISDRLAVAAGSGRWQQWEVAGSQWRTAPLTGTGAGDYRFEWAEERPNDQAVVNAHSLYLETLGESGLIGLVLLVVPGVAGVVAAVRMWPRAPDELRREVAVAGAAVVTVGLHMAGDWDWQLPAVVLPVVVLAAAALRAAARAEAPEPAPEPGPWAGAAVAVPALVAILVVVPPTLAARDLDDARSAARAGDLPAALADARRAVARDPASASARLLEANILSDLGRPVQADAAYRAALDRSPRNWVILADWGASLAARGHTDEAAVLIARALVLNPLEPRVEVLAELVGLTPPAEEDGGG